MGMMATGLMSRKKWLIEQGTIDAVSTLVSLCCCAWSLGVLEFGGFASMGQAGGITKVPRMYE